MKWQDIKHCEEADVYHQNIRAGKITRTREGSIFRYNAEYIELKNNSTKPIKGIAYNLPASQFEYQTKGVNLHPYFAGLLPEGLRLKAIVKNVKTSEDDLLSILIAAGADCIGDVSVIATGQLPTDVPPAADVENLHEVSFGDLFEESIYYSDDGGPGREASIPGIQQKISAGMISFPLKGKKGKGLYILKLSNPKTPQLVENEYFFMKMAKACGLDVAPASIVRDKTARPGLLVERFDRRFAKGSETPTKVHQEDACQFLDRYPAEKYRISYREIAEGIQTHSTTPVVDTSKLLRLIAFSYLISNGDLHAKNISIATDPESGNVTLTPCYDIVSTLPYGDSKMALKFEGRDDKLKRSDFIRFGERYRVREQVIVKMLDELVESAGPWIDKIPEIFLAAKQEDHLRKMIKRKMIELKT